MAFLRIALSLGALVTLCRCVRANELALPRAGNHALHVLSPTTLELEIVTQLAGTTALADIIGENFTPHLPPPDAFTVTANGAHVAVKSVGFKRRLLYAPLDKKDVRLGNWLYLELAQPLAGGARIEVSPRRGRAGPLGPSQELARASGRPSGPARPSPADEPTAANGGDALPSRTGGDGAPPPAKNGSSQLEGDAPSSPRSQLPLPSLWPPDWKFTASVDPHRESPAIHVSEVGYDLALLKEAAIGYYLGSVGELPIGAREFRIVDAASQREVFRGPLVRRADKGFPATPPPYLEVFVADFSALKTPGLYRLAVDSIGVSAPFRIHDGAAMAVARAYALGLYHQRCGAENALPFTRFTHAACHLAPAEVPATAAQFPFTWKLIGELAAEQRADASRPHTPFANDEKSQLYPFVRRDPVDVSGGHHDAGDYSKYTANSAALVHTLVFAVDALPGVAALDNLGLPESGDGSPDLLQEAKWEADFIAKLQDDDGGFYFLVYPRDRRYESNALPEAGEPQVVWPKNTAVTAAAVAALAQCASSPHFKRHYPREAARYLAQAKRGWEFLHRALSGRNPTPSSTAGMGGDAPSSPRPAANGADGAAPSTPDAGLATYQRLSHYGDNFAHRDELAWAACELFLATGDANFQRELFRWLPDPTSDRTRRWGWWRLSESFGNAIRSYAFAARSGRLPKKKLDARYLSLCEGELLAAADDALANTNASAYGTAFPVEAKRFRNAGWYFSLDTAMDLAVGAQLAAEKAGFRDVGACLQATETRSPASRLLQDAQSYLAALARNLAFEAGVNPLNRTFITGLGRWRQREVVSQYAHNDRRALPPSGIPLGNIQAGLPYHGPTQTLLRTLSFPDDGDARDPFAYMDRWSDTHNVSTEFVVTNQARGLVSAAFLAARTPAAQQPWRAVGARIVLSNEKPKVGDPVTARLDLVGGALRPDEAYAGETAASGRKAPPTTASSSLSLRGARKGDAAIQFESQKRQMDRHDPAGAGSRDDKSALGLGDADLIWEARDAEPTRGREFTFTPRRGGAHWIEAEAMWPDGRRVFAAIEFRIVVDSTAWVEDALPEGASEQPGGEQWNWIDASPAPFSGAKAHASAAGAGVHEHGFVGASEPLEVQSGDVLFVHVWLDPQNPPREVLVSWNDGSWEHRAYWGDNVITYGAAGTVGRRAMGALPATGQWVRLEVPARAVGLEGRSVRGMSFASVDGRAVWDLAGVRSANAAK